MKVLLLNLPDIAWSGKGYSSHLGLGYIGAVLERAGHEVKALDMAYTKEICRKSYLDHPKGAESAIEGFQPDMVAASVTTPNRFNVIYWSKLVKDILPDSKFVIGGPHVCYDVEGMLKPNPTIDFVVNGEGEETVIELADVLENNGRKTTDIPGLAIRGKNGEVVNNGFRSFIKDLDLLPFPARHLFPMKKYDFRIGQFKNVKAGTMISSRGCPIGCKFCSTSHFWGRGYRFRSATNVVDEIEQIFSDYPFVREIVFFDDSITIRKDRVFEMCDEIKKRKIDFNWACWSRVDIVDEPMLRRMYDAGCSIMSFGVESGSQRMLENIGKRTTVEQIRRTIKMCQDIGIEPRATVIIGLPGETLKDAEKTIKLIEELAIYPNDIHVNCFTMLLPGTPWFEDFQKENPDFNWANPPKLFSEKSVCDSKGNILFPLVKFSDEEVKEIKRRIKIAKFKYSSYRYPQYLPKRLFGALKTKLNSFPYPT